MSESPTHTRYGIRRVLPPAGAEELYPDVIVEALRRLFEVAVHTSQTLDWTTFSVSVWTDDRFPTNPVVEAEIREPEDDV